MCKFGQPSTVIRYLEIRQDKTILHESKNQFGISEMKRRFREHRFARQQRLRNLGRDTNCPVMVPVPPIGKSNKKSSVGECLHLRE